MAGSTALGLLWPLPRMVAWSRTTRTSRFSHPQPQHRRTTGTTALGLLWPLQSLVVWSRPSHIVLLTSSTMLPAHQSNINFSTCSKSIGSSFCSFSSMIVAMSWIYPMCSMVTRVSRCSLPKPLALGSLQLWGCPTPVQELPNPHIMGWLRLAPHHHAAKPVRGLDGPRDSESYLGPRSEGATVVPLSEGAE